jgi:hypothetical protein
MLDEFMGQPVVVDLRGPFVCLGTLKRADEQFLEMRDTDLHDLRDSETNREHYVAASKNGGIMRNRKRVLIVRAEVVAIALLKDVVAG